MPREREPNRPLGPARCALEESIPRCTPFPISRRAQKSEQSLSYPKAQGTSTTPSYILSCMWHRRMAWNSHLARAVGRTRLSKSTVLPTREKLQALSTHRAHLFPLRVYQPVFAVPAGSWCVCPGARPQPLLILFTSLPPHIYWFPSHLQKIHFLVSYYLSLGYLPTL